ncbi:MAG: hypothetical protein VXW15_06000 [Bdellovibrionota bacterium]|nr:hypothetical protein [Bdellovibrionota bacterium]
MKIICVLFFLINILSWILVNSSLKSFVDIPSLIIVFLPIYMAIAYRHGWKSLFSLKFHTDVWVKNGKEQDGLLKTIGHTALLTGALGMAAGLVLMFFNSTHPFSIAAQTNPAMKISLLTSTYALSVFLVIVLVYFVGREDPY